MNYMIDLKAMVDAPLNPQEDQNRALIAIAERLEHIGEVLEDLLVNIQKR